MGPSRPTRSLFFARAVPRYEVRLLGLDPKASPLSDYYPAVALTALLAGIAPGAMVAIAGVLIAWWGFMTPVYSFSLERHGDVIMLITFALDPADERRKSALGRATHPRRTAQARV
jgi:hypothetical protein